MFGMSRNKRKYMNELTKKITRSYTRKKNLGNYESADYMASYSEEVPADTTQEEVKRVSTILYELAKSDVEEAILEYQKEQARERIVEQKKQDYKDDNDL